MYVRSSEQRKIDVREVLRAKKNWCTWRLKGKEKLMYVTSLGQRKNWFSQCQVFQLCTWAINTIFRQLLDKLLDNLCTGTFRPEYQRASFFCTLLLASFCYKCFCSAQVNNGFLLTCNGVDHKCFCGLFLAKVVQVFLYRQGQTSTLADP